MNATAFKMNFDEAEQVNVWPAPDMTVLAAGRREPPVITKEMFGPIWPMLSEMAQGAGAPVDYVAVSFLAVTASLIGGKRKVKPYAEADWTEPCILWAGLVGDPSFAKSPALDRTTLVLRDMEQSYAEQHKETVNFWRSDAERAKVEFANYQARVKEAAKEGASTPPLPADAIEPKEPQRRRLLVQDSTPEKLAEILSGNPTGTLHVRDELAGWLTSFDRYTPGGREFWLEAYGGRPFVIDRKGSPEPTLVTFNGVSVVGGIQPEKLADALFGRSKPDDGLVARFLWTWPNRPDYQRPKRCTDHSALKAIYDRLEQLEWGVGPDGRQVSVIINLDAHAADVFEQFERDNREAGDEAWGLYKSFCGKLGGMALRLALVSELARWAYEGGPEPKTISAKMIAAVAEFMDEYAKPTAMRVFGDAALPPVERNAAVLARVIQRHKLHKVNARDLKRTPYKQHLPGMREAEPLNEALAFLVEADWLQPIGDRAGGNPGRRTSDYAVNPAVHGGQ
jgi:putative DNA primase/helicase